MNNRTFLAKNWLKGNRTAQIVEQSKPILPNELPPIPTDLEVEILQEHMFPTFEPHERKPVAKDSNFFVNGWSGDSLQTKNASELSTALNIFSEDVRSQLNGHMFNRTLKQEIYNEFLSFCEFKAVSNSNFSNYDEFWDELFNEHSPEAQILKHFVDIYSFRVSVIYFFKIRFLNHLSTKAGLKLDQYNLINPNAFIIQTFKKTSSSELVTKAFQSNRYNWFRPNANLMHKVSQLSGITNDLSISEIVKTISKKTEAILLKKQYSHVFSHRNFGLFINSLLINYSNWFYSTQKGSLPKSIISENNLEVISCKFAGHYLESMSLSHWLGQENNLYIKWKQLLCPDFKGSQFETGQYLKLLNELQFLTFNIQIASKQQYDIIPFLCSTMRSYRKNKKANSIVQRSFFQEESQQSSTYDRIVLNLSDTPKNNPYFYLMNEINGQLKSLKDDGKIFLLCNKNIFIPSQKEKIKSLLEKFKFETCFVLEQVKGKGEIPNYIFVFSKSNEQETFDNSLRYSFPTFRLSGDLNTFYDFSKLTSELQSFFRNNLFEIPPYYQKEINNQLKIEFYTDALLDGRFVSSMTKDSSQVTHPKFFSNLIKSCTRFDRLFDIYPLSNEKENANKAGEFFDSIPLYQFALVAIVDYRLTDKTKVEIVPYKSFKSKTIEYGMARCQYFGLNPRISNLNLNIFRDYFNSSLGQQVIDLTFTGNYTKFKSKISALLFPAMFIDSKAIPESLAKAFDVLTYDEKKLEEIPPKDLAKKFVAIEAFMRTSFVNYPRDIMSLLTKFRVSILNLSDSTFCDLSPSLFSNPRIKEQLMKLDLHPLFPNNHDVFSEFHFRNKNELIKNLTTSKHIEKFSAGEILHGLELYSEETKLLTFYGKKTIILFLNIMIQYLYGRSISSVLQSIQIPDASELEQILEKFNSANENYTDLLQKVEQLISSFFIISLNQNPS